MQYGDLMSKALISRLVRDDDEVWKLVPGNGKISGALRPVAVKTPGGVKMSHVHHGVNDGLTLKAAERRAASDPHHLWRVWSAGQCYLRRGPKNWVKNNA